MRYQKSGQNITVLVGVVFMLAFAGCQSSLWSSKNIKGEPEKIISGDANKVQASPQPEAQAKTGQPTVEQELAQQQAVTPQQVMAQVRQLGAVNPTAQAALMQELEKVEPDLWPEVMQSFNSRLAMGERFQREEMLAARLDTQTGNLNQEPGYVSQNPYYANQPIPTGTTPAPAQGQPSSYTYPSSGQNPNQSYSSYGNAYPQSASPQQNQAPSGYPTTQPYPSYPGQQPYPNAMQQNGPMPLPNTSSQPFYPRTSATSPEAGVIQTSYETSAEEPGSEGTREQALPPTGDVAEKDAVKRDGSDLARHDWHALLAASINSLQKELEAKGGEETEAKGVIADADLDQLRLRFMLLAAGRGIEAVEPIEGRSAAVTDFWTNEMYGLSALLDERKPADPALRNTAAKHKLADALNHLGKASSLEVRRLAFCKAVNGFANIEQFEKYTFKPGEQVILYAELENLKYEETIDGYKTSLSVGYQIYDAKDHRIENQAPSSSEECSRALRRDYYVSQVINLPTKSLYPGRHILKLTVEDKLGQKYGESTIEFDVE